MVRTAFSIMGGTFMKGKANQAFLSSGTAVPPIHLIAHTPGKPMMI